MSDSQDYIQKARALIHEVQGGVDAVALRWLSDEKKLSMAIASALIVIAERLAPLETPEVSENLINQLEKAETGSVFDDLQFLRN